jgi:hypothetical protein
MIYTRTWNVMTMLKTGKMNEIADEMLKNISTQYGLIVNESKTKYMKCTRKENTLDKLQAGDGRIDQVKSFNYLGSTVNGNNTLEEEIRERIAKGNMQIKLFSKVN